MSNSTNTPVSYLCNRHKHSTSIICNQKKSSSPTKSSSGQPLADCQSSIYIISQRSMIPSSCVIQSAPAASPSIIVSSSPTSLLLEGYPYRPASTHRRYRIQKELTCIQFTIFTMGRHTYTKVSMNRKFARFTIDGLLIDVKRSCF